MLEEIRMLVPNRYYVPSLIGPPFIFSLINSSLLIGLLTLVVGFSLTLIFLRILNLIVGEQIVSRYLGPKMNVIVMIAMYIWVGMYIPSFIQ